MRVITTTKGARDLPRWFPASFELLKGLDAGTLDIALPDGRVFRIEGRNPGPSARLDVRRDDLFSRVAREGELGFCEAYLDGWWDTPDLQVLLDVLLSSQNWVKRSHPAAALVRAYEQFMHWMKSNSKTQAKRNISAHYDLGNAFYGRWLDPTMTYSSAIFDSPADDMVAAQTRKVRPHLRRHRRRAWRASAGDRLRLGRLRRIRRQGTRREGHRPHHQPRTA